MSYNAVLRKENEEVIGRVLLSNLITLPRKWEVMYGEDFIPISTDLKTLLCDSKVPLSVYTVPVERQITVKSEYVGGEVEVSVTTNDPMRKVKKMICNKMETEGKAGILKDHSMHLYLDDEQLGTNKPVEQCFLKRKCTIHLKFTKRTTYRPGYVALGGIRAVNLEAEHKHERGVPVKKNWEGYSYGLNIYGTCPKTSCPSHKIPLKQTSYRAGYGFLRIDLNKQTFYCPACWSRFYAANFVVCDARALFRFKKTQGRDEVQSTILESFGGIDEYARFNDEGEEPEYDWIEVKTVKEDESFYVCSRCDLPIRMKVDEVLYDCGHPVHLACKEDQCGICNARIIPDAEFNALTGPSLIISGKRKRTPTKL